MSGGRRGQVVGGIVLILIGAVFMIDKLGWFDFSWPLILVGIGLALLIQSVVDRHRQPVQSGVLLLLLGLIFLAAEQDWLPYGLSRDWPFILFAIAIALLAGYWANPAKRHNLMGGIILLVIGSLFLASEYRYFRWRDFDLLMDWWPLLLLALGVYMVVRPQARRTRDN